ncbi:MAG: YtxH domain-containing protein [Chitinophagaceae bacterium]|nr:MAG: YtxH domain-containing protein [Chitinophagaceae bacterium]
MWYLFYSLTLNLQIMSTKSKVLIGILGAAAAGVVIGLLLAPEKGKDTRKKIRDTAGDWADNLSGLWQKGRAAAEDAYSDARDKVKGAKSSAEDKANKVKENFS